MRRSRLAGFALLAASLGLGSTRAGAELRVFVTNEKSDDVTVIDAATRAVVGTIRVGKRPRGVAVSPDGRRVYVTNSNSDSLSVIDAKTLEVLSTVPAGIDPEGLTQDRKSTRLNSSHSQISYAVFCLKKKKKKQKQTIYKLQKRE